MQTTVAGFAEEVARLAQAADDHPSVALCQLAKSRTLFSDLTTDLRERLAAIRTMEAPPELPPKLEALPATTGIRVSRRAFRCFAASVILAAVAMAALGYRLGQSPTEKRASRLSGIIGRAADTWGRVWTASPKPAPVSDQEGGV